MTDGGQRPLSVPRFIIDGLIDLPLEELDRAWRYGLGAT